MASAFFFFLLFAVMCFLLKASHFDVSPSVPGGQRGLGEAERSGHPGAASTLQGADPFPESGKPAFEEAQWV